MWLKIHAWLYRLTGYYSNYAKAQELRIYRKCLADMDDSLEHAKNLDLTLPAFIRLQVGLWQVHNRFTRRFN